MFLVLRCVINNHTIRFVGIVCYIRSFLNQETLDEKVHVTLMYYLEPRESQIDCVIQCQLLNSCSQNNSTPGCQNL